MNKSSQKEVLEYCISNKISFSVFRAPNTKKSKLFVAKKSITIPETDLNSFLKKEGYIIAPYSFSENKIAFIPADYVIDEFTSIKIYEDVKRSAKPEDYKTENNYYADFSSYLSQYKKLYQNIEDGIVKKAILSRVKYVEGIGKETSANLFYNMCNKYPNAYVFMYYTPQTGLWLGASPELLFKSSNEEAETVSLAGSRRGEAVSEEWNNKEKDEQQIVSDFVEKVLNKYEIKDAKVNGPETIKAGKVMHLRTSYIFNSSGISNQMGSFISDLHPTPAVCGLPKNEAQKVIANCEKHKRTYYAGFIGETQKSAISLYVNIRSLKFVNNGVELYLGGGIVKGSEPEKEWQETELKSSTMQDVINGSA